CGGAAMHAVEEIAEEHHFACLGLLDRLVEAREVIARGARRQRNAECPEARRLAEMEVGDQERLPRGPVGGALGEEDEVLAGDGAVDHSKRLDWAPACAGVTSDSGTALDPNVALSNSSCMRRTRSASFSLVSFSRKRPTMIGNA